jgi:hypothetical protein
LPGLQTIADELSPRGVKLVTVMNDGTPKNARAFATRAGLQAPVLVGTRSLMAAWQVRVYPWLVIFDESGKAVFAVRGARPDDEIRRTIERFLPPG